ncbi:MAG TPA: FAD-dependent oxidoreductase, partial [Paracoccaceae bacterium]|nr:FAD-dependent oxidoreductase [Paracoccaceae bacterium]
PELEAESGQHVGYHRTGGFAIATTEEQRTALELARSRGRRHGVDTDWIDMAEVRRLCPLLKTDGLTGALWEPTKGHVDPASATQAFATAARKRGATIYRHAAVTETHQTADGGWRVVTPDGTITCEYLVNAAGLWAREVAALAGIRLPLMPVEHHYLVTEEIPEVAALGHELPNVSYPEANVYVRQEGNGILLGAYEDRCTHWAENGTPLDFGHELLPDDIGRMDRNFALAMERMPVLAEVGIKRVINGPMIFSPDLGPLLGPYPGLSNYFCAAGVMTGFNQGAGVGRTLAEWIIEGEPGLDMTCWDVARFGGWAGRRYTRERTRYFYENRSARTYPYQQHQAGRPVRMAPIHARLADKGAVFGFSYGLETPAWYARPQDEARDIDSYGRANWWPAVCEEAQATRSGVALFEVSSFAKYRVEGAGAEAWLGRILAGRVPRRAGRMALTPMLSPNGRLIGDFTVARLADQRFMLFGSGPMRGIHMRWFRAHLPDRGVSVSDLSDELSGLMLAGPKARDLLQSLAEEDVSGGALPFLGCRRMELEGAAEALVNRISFTGELGYELYTPALYQHGLYDAILGHGEALGLRHAGGRAMMVLRLEKGFPSWGLELTADYTVMEPGMDRFVDWQKKDFIGSEASRRARDAGAQQRLSTLVVDAAEADCVGGESIFRDGEYVGYTTSGGYGATVGESLALGYIRSGAWDEGAVYEIEQYGRRIPAHLSAGARVDPGGERMRS